AGIVSPLLIDKKLIPFKTQSRKELTPKNALFSFSFLRRFFPKKSIYNDEFFDKWDKKHPISVDVVPGAAMMISKKLFQKVGGFDENFFLYFEENDISKRVRNLGFKLYLEPKAKVIHEVGQSTKKIKNAQEIFKRSRFHYFKKHYGFLNAISLELIFAIDKSSLILAIIVLSALFLRIYKIDSLVPFIGDQGWFYISARDLILNKTIPLVGITTSHVWLHQGPLWTYIVATLFSIFKFNPVLPFYFTALFDVLTLILIFKICKEIFSFKTALFSSFLYAFSPIIILNSRTAYHTSLIPFFVILLFYSLYKWMKGDVKYFPFAIFNLFILYNLELQTFLFILLFLAMLFYGYWKKTFWFKKVLNIKIIFYSVIAFLIPMIPVLIYDFNNGFPQTIVFAGWIAYKVYSAIPFLGDGNIGSFINQFFNLKTYFLDFFQKLVFIPNGFFSFTLILLSIAYLIFNNMTSFIKKTYYIQNFLLLYFILFLFLGIILGKTASGAYLMSLFVPVVIMVSVFLNYLSKYKFTFYLILIGLFYIGFVNSVNLVSNNYYVGLDMGYGPSLKERIGISRMFISGSGNNSFSIYARGEGANFESFTMNYRYLTWYYGKEFKKRGGDIIYIVEEFPNQIKFEKIYQNVKRSNTN
ncbi:MAG: hypothetical protein COU25_00430, partial [Candidatus Levybacteria bacterium CG10_big_fil_rev_8_21_14_0_10_35_13]